MKRTSTILPEGWPRPRGYSNGVLVEGGGRHLFIAGQIGWDKDEVLATGFLDQWDQALANVAAVVAAAGGETSDLVRVTVYVTDKALYTADLRAVGDAWKRRIGAHWPSMTLVEVQDLLEPGALVEIEATAVLV